MSKHKIFIEEQNPIYLSSFLSSVKAISWSALFEAKSQFGLFEKSLITVFKNWMKLDLSS